MLFKRLGALAGWAVLIIYVGARLILDLIGYTTAPEDFEALQTKLPNWLEWLFSTPWPVPAVLLAAFSLFVIWICWPRSQKIPVTSTTSRGEDQISEISHQEVPKEPAKPILGSPRQMASEPYLSWWHIPVTVDGGSDSPNGKIEHATVELVSKKGPSLKLRWQADNEPRGTEETTLLEGRERYVPIAIRCETGQLVAPHHEIIADGCWRITGSAYLQHGNLDKFKFSGPSVFPIRLRIRSSTKSWDAQEYRLRAPASNDGNGQFVLELISSDT